ncbi:YqjF family protein [Halostagnicola bangensis]
MNSEQTSTNVDRTDRSRRGRRRRRDRPRTPHVASMTWRDGLFVHWPIDHDALRPHVPDSLRLETRDGSAWISVLPFVLSNAGIRGSPELTRFAFPEINVRTYVQYRGEPGLFFFSIDVGNPLVATAVGRTTRLPVYNSRMHVGRADDRVSFSSERTTDRWQTDLFSDGRPTTDGRGRFSASYEPDGAVYTAEPGSLEYWLTARKRFYAPESRGVMTGEIAHEPWPLRPVTATIHENDLFRSNGLPEPNADPIVSYCERLEMTGSILRRIRQD